MKSTTRCRPPQARSFRVLQRPNPEESGVLRVTIGKKRGHYHFDFFRVSPAMGKLGVEFGRGPDDQPYHCLYRHDGQATCDCKGFARWSHCKHADLVPALLKHLGRA